MKVELSSNLFWPFLFIPRVITLFTIIIHRKQKKKKGFLFDRINMNGFPFKLSEMRKYTSTLSTSEQSVRDVRQGEETLLELAVS